MRVDLGDCRQILPTLEDDSFDHVISDPPFSDHTHNKQRRGAIKGKESESGRKAEISRTRDLGFAAMDDGFRLFCAGQFARLCKRWILIFTDDRGLAPWAGALEMAGLQWVRTVIWRKLGSTPQFTGDRPAQGVEFIVLAHRPGKKRWNGGGKHGVYEFPIVLNRGQGSEERVHTTQKPRALMEALIRDFTDPGETILDPFAGSGTTIVAAKCLGRVGYGIELDANYAQIAQKRIDKAREQYELFQEVF